MRRVGNLFEQAFSRENLYKALLDASRHKRNKRATYEFWRRCGYRMETMYQALHDGTYRPQPYHTFEVYEPKLRKIYAPSFYDLVVQHAIYRVIYPIFDATFIEESFACRKGKGTHAASDYAQKALRAMPDGTYTLKLDVRKFFYRIDRAVLRKQIERRIKDQRLIDVMMLFAEYGDPVGIPIGNLLSQTYALIYLNDLDHFIKRQLGIRLYCRYVDDFVLFGVTREEGLSHRERIVEFLREELHLELSKSSLAPRARGINFVGYRTWAGKRFIRKRALFVARRAIRDGKLESLISCLGHARRTHSFQHLLTLTRSENVSLYQEVPHLLKRHHHHSGDLPAKRGVQRALHAAGWLHLYLDPDRDRVADTAPGDHD